MKIKDEDFRNDLVASIRRHGCELKVEWVNLGRSAELPQVGRERQFRVICGTPDTPRLGLGSLSDNLGPGVGHLNINAWLHEGPT